MKSKKAKSKMLQFTAAIFAVLILVVVFFANSVLTNADRVLGPWSLTAPTAINAVCGGQDIPSTLSTVVNNDPVSGSFTGQGYLNSQPSSPWTMSGSITNSSINFSITLEGSAKYNMVGAIAPDGSITGTSDFNCQTFSMPAGSAKRFEGNHGQYEKTLDNKKDGAKSKVGKPVNSRGKEN